MLRHLAHLRGRHAADLREAGGQPVGARDGDVAPPPKEVDDVRRAMAAQGAGYEAEVVVGEPLVAKRPA
jgi:hypothetical protein